MAKVFLPQITPEQLGQFFQATAQHAPRDLEPTIIPVFVNERGRRFNLIKVDFKPGCHFSRCEKAEEVDKDGLPLKFKNGYYRLVPAEEVDKLCYLAKNCEINFYPDGEGSFIAITSSENIGPIIQERIKQHFGKSLTEWPLF